MNFMFFFADRPRTPFNFRTWRNLWFISSLHGVWMTIWLRSLRYIVIRQSKTRYDWNIIIHYCISLTALQRVYYDKEQREYVNWLKSLHDYMSKWNVLLLCRSFYLNIIDNKIRTLHLSSHFVLFKASIVHLYQNNPELVQCCYKITFRLLFLFISASGLRFECIGSNIGKSIVVVKIYGNAS